MAHGDCKEYKVCVYDNSYTMDFRVIKVFHSYDKAKKFLSEYLRENPDVTRAYIESVNNYRNDKRNQWN